MCMCVCSVVSNFLQPHGLEPARPLYPWNFLVKNTGVDCHSLLLRVFLIQGSNLHLLCQKQYFKLIPYGSEDQKSLKALTGKIKVLAGLHCFLETLGEESVFLPFPDSTDHLPSSIHGPSFLTSL